jgi:hypothetical protein
MGAHYVLIVQNQSQIRNMTTLTEEREGNKAKFGANGIGGGGGSQDKAVNTC